MVGLKKRVRTDGDYAGRFMEAFQSESQRTSIWSDQESDADSCGEDVLSQPGSSHEPDKGTVQVAKETVTRRFPDGVPQDVLASATSDELALVGMADLLKRQEYSQESLDNQQGWNNHFQQQLTDLRQLIEKSCSDMADLNARLFAVEEKLCAEAEDTGR